MINFGLITEGPTDQIVIDYILTGYFGDDNISVNPLQPSLDETDIDRMGIEGGWTLVFEYCNSDDFKQAFSSNDYLIVQIDTDICEEVGYEVCRRNDEGVYLTSEELVRKVCEKIQSKIGEEFYNNYSERIIFAIAVDSTECWLLPLYYNDARSGKTVNCLNTLNHVLPAIEGFTIAKKDFDYYQTISKKYLKKKNLMASYKANPSFKIFMEELINRNCKVQLED
jgi:hypothetical protein